MNIPTKMGEASHTFIGPDPEYCPIASSIKNSGIPTNVNIKKYGTRKAPATNQQQSCEKYTKMDILN